MLYKNVFLEKKTLCKEIAEQYTNRERADSGYRAMK